MASSSQKIVLKCTDGTQFEIDEAVALKSQTLKHMIEDGCATNIPMPNVTAPILTKVIEYCKRHVAADKASDADLADKLVTEDLKSFDDDFVKLDQPTLVDLILAVNYLDIKGLLDLTCQAAADMIKDKSPEEIRTIFNIENDFTAEEELEVRQQNVWAFE